MTNAGYEIVRSHTVGKYGAAIGVRRGIACDPAPIAVWSITNDGGKIAYYWGAYCSDKNTAVQAYVKKLESAARDASSEVWEALENATV